MFKDVYTFHQISQRGPDQFEQQCTKKQYGHNSAAQELFLWME